MKKDILVKENISNKDFTLDDIEKIENDNLYDIYDFAEYLKGLPEYTENNRTLFNKEAIKEFTFDSFKADLIEIALRVDYKTLIKKSNDITDYYLKSLYEQRTYLIESINLINKVIELREKFPNMGLGYEHIKNIKEVESCLYIHKFFIDETIEKINAIKIEDITIDKKNIKCITYTIEEASQILGISKTLLYKFVEEKSIEHRRFGKKIVFDHDVIMEAGKARAEKRGNK